MSRKSTSRAAKSLETKQLAIRAAGWEELVRLHGDHAARLVALLEGEAEAEDVIEAYIKDMRVPEGMRASVVSRATRSIDVDSPRVLAADRARNAASWTVRPDRVIRSMRAKRRRRERHELIRLLAYAQAQEAVLDIVVRTGVLFVRAAFGHSPLDESLTAFLDDLPVSAAAGEVVRHRILGLLGDAFLPDGDDELNAALRHELDILLEPEEDGDE